MTRVAVLLLFVWAIYFSGFEAKAGQTDYESLTLRLYNEQKWDSLLITGEEAINMGFDYYYMRVRTGRAAFEKQRYTRASVHLEKALEYNSGDEYATYLLYKSYEYSGKALWARWLLYNSPVSFRKSLGMPGRLPQMYLEAGPAYANHSQMYTKHRRKDAGTYSEVYQNIHSGYLLAGVNKYLGTRAGINAAFSYLNFLKRREVKITGLDSLSGEYHVFQYEYYCAPSFAISRRINISPAFRLMHVSLSNPLESSDTLVQRLIGPAGTLVYNDLAAGGEVSYLSRYVIATAGGYYIRVDKLNTTQLTGQLFVMPFGNLNLYSSSTVSYRKTVLESNYFFTQMIGLKIAKPLWGEISYTGGDFSNTGEYNLQVVYNAFDKINYRLAARLIFNVSDDLKLSIRYQRCSRVGSELFYPISGEPEINTYNYINQTFTGGIVWNLH